MVSCATCGRTDHKRSTSLLCPGRKVQKKFNADDCCLVCGGTDHKSQSNKRCRYHDEVTDSGSSSEETPTAGCSKCGRLDHTRSTSPKCPLRKKRKARGSGKRSRSRESSSSDSDSSRKTRKNTKHGYRKPDRNGNYVRKYNFSKRKDGRLTCPKLNEKENFTMLAEITQNLKDASLYFENVAKKINHELATLWKNTPLSETG